MERSLKDSSSKTVVIGLGNPLLSDDAVGLHAIKRLADELIPDIDIKEASVGGMELVEMMLGYRNAIIVDSIMTKKGAVGDIYRITPEDFGETRNISNLHNVGFIQALHLWSELGGDRVPEHIVVFAVEVKDVHTFSERMTPAVEDAVIKVVELVRNELAHLP